MTTNGRAPAAPSSGDCEGRVRTRVDALSAMQLVVGLSLAAAAAAVLGQPVAFVGDAVPAPLTATPGDPERGRQVVVQREQGHCILCHAVPDPTVRFAGNVHDAGHAQEFGCYHRDKASRAGPDRMNDIEWLGPTFAQDGGQRTKLGRNAGASDVVHIRAVQPPMVGYGFLSERVDVNVVLQRQPLDQGQQSRDDSMLAGSIHTPRHEQCDFHRPIVSGNSLRTAAPTKQ